MANPRYRFELETTAGVKKVYPGFDASTAIEYEKESREQFYRRKLSGRLTFFKDDYELIMSQPFETVLKLRIFYAEDYIPTWKLMYTGSFVRTDCTINEDDRTITVQPTTLDVYTDVLAGMDKEYNLIPLSPNLQNVGIVKRPLIQLYVPGDNVVSCYLGGTWFEQDAYAESDWKVIEGKYKFSLNCILKEVKVTSNGTPNASGVYIGRLTIDPSAGTYTGRLTAGNNYYIKFNQGALTGRVSVQLYDNADHQLFVFFKSADEPFNNETFTMKAVAASGATGTMECDMASYYVYGRYLCDVNNIGSINTDPIPTEDIVDNNYNYSKVTGYGVESIYISNQESEEPTEWGLSPNGGYYQPPYSLGGDIYYPMAASLWRSASLWFKAADYDWILEEQARKEYTLRNAYDLGSCINVLLKQFAPLVQHESTPVYSQFLYGAQNPISKLDFRLFITPKSNILKGEYKEPARKAMITLRDITNMLRDVFKCYWFIQGNKFRIEHIEYFRNGGTYTGKPVVGYDLTNMLNYPNKKKWSFDTSLYSYDKMEMAERYQFDWMDDVTVPFRGLPIEVKSSFVEKGKIEEINVGKFTSDVDLMLLNPSAMSNEGFALLAPFQRGGKYVLPFTKQTVNGVSYYLQNGYLAYINLQPYYWLYDMPARRLEVNGVEVYAKSVQRKKKQNVKFPAAISVNPTLLVKTEIGDGEISKLSVNLSSNQSSTALQYDTEQ